MGHIFSIVTFKITNEFSVSSVYYGSNTDRALELSLRRIEELKQTCPELHPCLNFVDKRTHYSIEAWESGMYNCNNYPEEFVVYDKWNKPLVSRGKGIKTAFSHYCETYLDMKMIGHYDISNVTIVFSYDKAQWFMQNQAAKIVEHRYRPELDTGNKNTNTNIFNEDLIKRIVALRERIDNFKKQLKKVDKTRLNNEKVNAAIKEYSRITAACSSLQTMVDGDESAVHVKRVTAEAYTLRPMVEELRQRAVEKVEKAKMSNKRFMDTNASFGQRISSLFSWR